MIFIVYVQQLDANLAELTAKFERATADKLKCQQEAEATNQTINLANRLVGGLASENVRWAEAVAGFKEQVPKSILRPFLLRFYKLKRADSVHVYHCTLVLNRCFFC